MINKRRIVSLIFILILFSSFFMPFFNPNNVGLSNSTEGLNLSAWETGDGNLTMYNESVVMGDNLQEDIYYNFTADLIDLSNCSHEFDAGYLETEFKDGKWSSPDYDNITVSDLINYNNYIPGFEDFYDIVGNLSDWVDLSLNEANDALYGTFNSTEVYNYPGTYSFTEDTIGGNPAGWDIGECVAGSVNIVEMEGQHRNVLELYENNIASYVFATNDFSGQTSGVIEFWVRTDDVNQETYIRFNDGGDAGVIGINLRIETANFQEESAGWADIAVAAADTWYHIKVVFDCGTYGLEGLAADTYHIYIDNAYIGTYNFANAVVDIDNVLVLSDSVDADYYSYWDAFGFDWILNYTIGDNYYWQYFPATYDLENHNITLNGNYIGTYSFTEDVVGDDPVDWVVFEGSGTVNVINNLGGHNKIVDLHDTGASTVKCIQYLSTPQDYGTFEWWWRTDDATDESTIYTRNGIQILIALRFNADKFQYLDGGYQDVGLGALDDIWYHIRIDFECTAGVYMGLAQYRWRLFIDDMEFGPYGFFSDEVDIDQLSFQSDATHSLYHQYIDAVSYSWDTDYCQVEDTWNFDNDYKSWNINPHDISDLFLDNWDYYGTLGGVYSVDGEFGVHKKYLEIYDDSDTGFYRANYSFEDDLIGSNPADFSVVELTGTVNVISDLVGHRKVVELHDTGGSYVQLLQYFSENKTNGIVEFWMRTTNAAHNSYFYLYDSVIQVLCFAIKDDDFDYYDGAWREILSPALSDTWYHIKIIFELGTDEFMGLAQYKWRVFIDDVEYGDYNFATNRPEVNIGRWQTKSGDVDYYYYLDAIGYSWDSNYIIGDNIIEIGTQIWNTFDDNQTDGTLSFWTNGDFDEYFRIYLMNDIDFITTIKINESYLYYLNGTEWVNSSVSVANDWHYVRIAFDTTADTYDLWFDSTTNYTSYCDDGIGFNLTLIDSDVPFQQTTTGIDRIMFETHSGYPVLYKVDALQYCWDPDGNEYWDCGTSRWDMDAGVGSLIIEDFIAGYTNVLNITDPGGTPDPDFHRHFDDIVEGWISFDVYIDGTNWGAADCFIMELWQRPTSREFSLQFFGGNSINTFWISTGEYYNTDAWININVSWDATTYWLYVNGTLVETGALETGVPINYIYFRTMYCTDDEVYLDNIRASFWYDCIDDYNLIPNEYAELDFKIDLDIDDATYVCYYLYWAFLTDSDERVNFSWYNFDTDLWENIAYDYFMDTDGTPGAWTEYYNTSCPVINNDILDPYTNSSGSLLFRIKILDFNDGFNFYFDEFRLLLWDYIHANVQKEFDWRGIWRYRWVLHNVNCTYYWTNWTYFEVIPMHECANFEGISESQYTTYWELISDEVVPVVRFNDSLDAGNWTLMVSDGDRVIDTNEIPTDDSYTDEFNPGTNHGNDPWFYMRYGAANIRWFSFLKWEYPYLDANYTTNSTFYYRGALVNDNPYIHVYHTTDFDEDTITWATQPAGGAAQAGWLSATGWQEEGIGAPNYYYKLNTSAVVDMRLYIYSKEYWRGYYPRLRHHLSKEYFGGGYFYMQTDESETISMLSDPYATNTTLYEGDFINLDTQSSASDILIKFYSGGDLQKTLIVLAGSTDSSRRIVGVYVNEDITFDQIEFVGTDMIDEEHFVCYDIEVNGYEAVDLYYGMYIDPDGQDYLMGQVGNYTLRIWDEVQEDKTMLFIESRNITLTYDLLTEIYIPLIRWNLKIYHYAYEFSTIEIYSVNITIYTIVENTTAGKDEILDFLLNNGTYVVNWTNGEDGVITSYNIILDHSQSLILSSTYFSVYFGLFTNDGLGLDRDAVRFYVNSVRKDFGPVLLQQDLNALVVQDYFNQTLYSATVNLRAFTEFNIYVEIFTLNLFNNYTHLIEVEIERNDIEIFCTIPPQMSFSYRFIPNVEYQIKTFYENGTKIDELDFKLETNGQIVSFGFYDIVLPYDPEPQLRNYMVIFSAFIILTIAFVVVVLFVRKAKDIGKTPSKKKLKSEAKVYRGSYAFNNQINLRNPQHDED